jgi:hypothetical protein
MGGMALSVQGIQDGLQGSLLKYSPTGSLYSSDIRNLDRNISKSKSALRHTYTGQHGWCGPSLAPKQPALATALIGHDLSKPYNR